MKIGFVTLQNLHPELKVASTRIRVDYAIEYMQNWVIAESFEELSDCALVIFQSRFTAEDIGLAKRLNRIGIKLVLDLTDPHWDLKNYAINGDTILLDKMFDEVDLVTLPTEELKKSFLKYIKKDVRIVPDRMDLEVHSAIKVHRDKNDFKKPYRILWHGSYGNLESLEIVRADLEKLGKIFNSLVLVAVYDRHKEFPIKQFDNVILDIREWSNWEVIRGLLECDVAINPRFDNWKAYKSNNKTIKAWAMGVPCAEYDIYKNLKYWLSSAKVRNELARENRKTVEEAYDSKQTAGEWKAIAHKYFKKRKKTRKKNEVAVVTAIVDGKDDLKDDQCTEGADFFAYTDMDVRSDTWEVRPINRMYLDPQLEAKPYKVLIHQYTTGYKYTLWLDGTLRLKVPVAGLVEKYLEGDMAVHKHFQRDCIYDEIEMYKITRRGKITDLNALQQKYINRGIKDHSGLCECGVLLRVNSDRVAGFNDCWWSELCSTSPLDQPAFIVALDRFKLKVNYFPKDIYHSDYFKYKPHKIEYQPIEPGEGEFKRVVIPGNGQVLLKRIADSDYLNSKIGEIKAGMVKTVNKEMAEKILADFPGDFVIVN